MTRFFVTPDDDRVTGTPDRDQISGLEGNDNLNGAGGNDELRGNEGDDLLNGGPGRDRLFGGPGRDTFILGPGSQTFPNADIIADFRPGRDLIGFPNGREFADLEIRGNDNTVLRDRVTGEILAIIRGVSPEEITPEDFTEDRRPARPTELRATYPTVLLPVGMVKYSMFGVRQQNQNCIKSKD